MCCLNVGESSIESPSAPSWPCLLSTICPGFHTRSRTAVFGYAYYRSGIAIAQTCLSFFERFLSMSMGKERTLISTASIVLVVTLPTDLVHEPLVPSLVATMSLGTYAWCIWQLYGRYREAKNDVERTRLSYLVIGGIVSVLLSATDLMPAFGVPSPAVGHIWLTVYVFLDKWFFVRGYSTFKRSSPVSRW